MKSRELVNSYLDFFKKRGHTEIPSAPLVPENDPSVLFTTAGMHPLVPFLMGEEHPSGKRLVNLQICLRTDDIDEVGDEFHHTFFEMLGNWSLGDYWKKEAISFSWQYLTEELKLDPERIWVTCFEGDDDSPRDLESANVWQSLGINKNRIVFLPKKDNWWGPAGETGPCGPDSEIFYDLTQRPHGKNCRPGDGCERFVEIWNDVFMQYEKTKEGKYKPLKTKNVDTGMGVERTTAILSGQKDNYLVEDLWGRIIRKIEELSDSKYSDNKRSMRIIADHTRAAVFLLSEEVIPSNKERGYVLRRLIRRAVRHGRILKMEKQFLSDVAETVIDTYKSYYPYLLTKSIEIKDLIGEEEKKFGTTLERGLKEIAKIKKIDAKKAFFLYESYGFPLELTEEIVAEKGQKINKEVFEKEFLKHKNLSRTASAGVFKGGLAGGDENIIKLHTATHIIHEALRRILGKHVEQKGSNISSERLRFDFSHQQKLTEEELEKVEVLVNDQIGKDLPVRSETMRIKEAIEAKALHFFAEKYGDTVKVYTIGKSNKDYFSKEVCGGPHVKSTGEIGRVTIKKQEKVGSGVIRIYATIA